MAGSRAHSRNASESRRTSAGGEEDNSVLGAVLDTRQLEAFGRKVTATAGQLMGDDSGQTYTSAMTSISRTMRRPALQRSVFSFTQQAPSELIRARVAPSEIAHRAITYISDDQLNNIPDDDNTYSLFQGFQASLPESGTEHRKGHRRRASKQKLLGAGDLEEDGPPTIQGLKKKRNTVNHRLEMMGIRKNMCATEIKEIDSKIANLHNMRRIVLDRLAGLEDEEGEVEKQIQELDNNIEDMQEDLDAQAEVASTTDSLSQPRPITPESTGEDPSFMSESIYQKLPSSVSPKNKRRPKFTKRKSMPVLHEHLESGTNLKTIPAHTDVVTALDFDMPFGTMVTAALDDTVRVWDLNLGRCMGFLEGHTASVRCLQVEDNIVATGSLDATIRLWDLSQAKYEPHEHKLNYDNPDNADAEDDEAALGFGNEGEDEPPPPPPDAMADCPLTILEAHIDEVTALHLRGDTLVSGSADKTLRQWDLVKGRCVQTLDVLWAAAQASATINGTEPQWRPTGRAADATADFVGALQVFDAALACGTADGMVRLWDLRSGQVHRSLVGHTGPVTCLQFDQTHLVTGSADRSIRIWDLRTGSIFDAYAYDNPITGMMFDSRHIVSAAGEDVVKVYDKTDSRHWDCGVGASLSVEDRMNASTSVVEKVRVKDGYMIEGRRSGDVGVWTC